MRVVDTCGRGNRQSHQGQLSALRLRAGTQWCESGVGLVCTYAFGYLFLSGAKMESSENVIGCFGDLDIGISLLITEVTAKRAFRSQRLAAFSLLLRGHIAGILPGFPTSRCRYNPGSMIGPHGPVER